MITNDKLREIRSQRVFHFHGHVLDFTHSVPCFDGKRVNSKERMVSMVKYLLKEICYCFNPITRPVPPILTNWECIDRKFLLKWICTICRQLVTIDEAILRLCYLDIDGFNFKIPHNNKVDVHRPVSIRFIADGYEQQTLTTLSCVPNLVNRFLSLSYSNKIIVIN